MNSGFAALGERIEGARADAKSDNATLRADMNKNLTTYQESVNRRFDQMDARLDRLEDRIEWIIRWIMRLAGATAIAVAVAVCVYLIRTLVTLFGS